MSDLEHTPAEVEHHYHHYVGNEIPWYVRLIWLLFWVFVVYYSVTYFLPSIQLEMVSPP